MLKCIEVSNGSVRIADYTSIVQELSRAGAETGLVSVTTTGSPPSPAASASPGRLSFTTSA